MKKKQMFYCLDKTDQYGNLVNMTMYGSESAGFYRALEIIYRPCVPR